MNFKVGDRVRCKNRDDSPALTKNAIYTIIGLDDDYYTFVNIKDDKDSNLGFYLASRFELVNTDGIKLKVGSASKHVETYPRSPAPWIHGMGVVNSDGTTHIIPQPGTFKFNADKLEEPVKSISYESIHFDHEATYYVPCFQKNPTNEKDGYPAFEYSMANATSDQQMVTSMNPDYVLVLKGQFDAKTQPFDLEVRKYNYRGENYHE